MTVPNKWVEFKALEVATTCTAATSSVSSAYTDKSIIQLFNDMRLGTNGHTAIGPFNVMKLLRIQCGPSAPIQNIGNWQGTNAQTIASYVPRGWSMSIKDFIASCAQACGGYLALCLDLDPFPGTSNDCYNAATYATNAYTVDDFFARNVAALASCSPANSFCWFEAWLPGAFDHVVTQCWIGQQQYYTNTAPVFDGSTVVGQRAFLDGFFTRLRTYGLTNFIYQAAEASNAGQQCGHPAWQGNSFGNAQYARAAISQSDMVSPPSSPAGFTKRLSWIKQLKTNEPSLTGVLWGLDTQPQSGGLSAGGEFRTNLTLAQRQAYLNWWFANQKAQGYTFVAPVHLVQDANKPVYDAQFDGTLTLIEHLLNTYNGGGGLSIVSDSATPSNTTVGTPIQFDVSASGGSFPYSYHWDFGDTFTAAVKSPIHTYTAAFNGNAVVTVTDSTLTKVSDPVPVVITKPMSVPTSMNLSVKLL